ncbi:hypothetical protein H0X09_00185 [Candidatus Saccharibacteria bacterium]|nr:hypothetical protein [Candidatus Saccharibacteria bacterium]
MARYIKFYLSVATISLLSALVFSPPASALSGSDWQAGRIIDDAIFFNPNTMNPGDIQTFLNTKVPVCDTNGTKIYSGSMTRAEYGTSRGNPPPYTCLKDYSQAIPAKSPDAYCGGSVSAGSKSAAQIIYDVAQACGVSAKAMIVLLQKEQSLVTDDWPWNIQYRSATGYGCPDTAPCDAEYYGFFNQVYNAARQFQRYAKQPNLYNFGGGRTSFVQYNPNAGCGGTDVSMQNQATAGLYNYTPYQPNVSALNNLYGSGDSCGAYGNRNFWRMYIDWFGSPNSNIPWAWLYEGQWAYSNSARTQTFTSVPTVVPGGKIYVRVKARNMGTQTWDQSFFHLAASRPMDSVGIFADSTWVSNSRAAKMLENTISPGGIATFEFALQAPNAAGTYSEYYNLVAEGRSWLNDLGLFFTVNVNTAISPSNSTNTTLGSGGILNKDDYLLSPDSQTVLTLQKDGNLTLNSNFKSVWSTGPLAGASRVVMQPDGNLVLYSLNNVPLWNSETSGNPGSQVVLQTDGNMVIYNSSNTPVWASYTIHRPDHLSYINTTLGVGRLYPGQSIETADRRFRLILQPDGNLVLYSPTRPTWATGTDGKQVSFLAMQPDGNLVLYDKSTRPLWHSSTSGRGSLRMIMQPDGNLVLYNNANLPFWHTSTSGVL